jgi:hypothetical protein
MVVALKTLLTWVISLFQRKPAGPTVLPHPEEPANNAQTVANTPLTAVLQAWFDQWNVPTEYRAAWIGAIDVEVYDAWPPSILASGMSPETPAATWGDPGKRHLIVLAKWLNPGVLAHEQAHNSYSLLSDADKSAFSAAYNKVKKSDPYIKLLYSINTYGLSSDVEGHAEIYRYIGNRMPASLIRFYPQLF